MSQGDFAKSVAGMSEISIAKYETSHPPKGAQLLKLEELALELSHKATSKEKRLELYRIASRFRMIALEELFASVPIPLREYLDPETGEDVGFLTLRVTGEDEINLAENVVALITLLRSGKRGLAEFARECITRLEESMNQKEIREYSNLWAKIIVHELDHTRGQDLWHPAGKLKEAPGDGPTAVSKRSSKGKLNSRSKQGRVSV